MKYVSTRGSAPVLAFDDVVLAGLARDGGLYLPETWPRLSAEDLRSMSRLDYPTLAARVIAPFAAPVINEADLHAIAVDAYENFDHPEVAPLKPIGGDTWLLELFHGPTLAFKDFALQVLSRLFDFILARRGERITIVGATSGDTGSAAIEACRDRDSIEIFILHPKGRVSDVQRRQMTTVAAGNVHNVAIEGTFDDCQDLVKAMFNDIGFRDRFRLGAVNSINWARIVAQVVYYVHAALKLDAPGRELDFAVPTGNFGNVFAGYAAREIGVPVRRLVIGSNRNDILTRFFASGRMEMGAVSPTLSPSMDIQVSSNFERLLFELHSRDGQAVSQAMRRFRDEGVFDVGATFGADPWRSLTRNVTTTTKPRRSSVPSTRRPASFSIPIRPLAWPPPAPGKAATACPSSPSPPPIRRSSPTRWRPPPASGRRCRRGSPICSSGPSATTYCRWHCPPSKTIFH